MNLQDLSPAAGSNPKAYRKGRGHGSGNGKTAGRGQKGQWARSGGGVRAGCSLRRRRDGQGLGAGPLNERRTGRAHPRRGRRQEI